MKSALILMCVVLQVAFAHGARAEGRARAAFALVVSNNASLGARRPDLHYADDDGAKYFELFQMIAGAGRARLLTSFDRDSARLFPSLVGRAAPPDRAHVTSAAAEIAVAAADALRSGSEVDFYFVFAGHGDVEEGRGIIELADGAFSSDDLERMLRSIPATRQHVILDSCNSFFMIDARKPGGRHFATSEDAARTLHDRLPHVGVFLSTSAEGEVFEWSELQSGIFSHVVRSGLMGAADADGDGHVSYAELSAFVATAVVDIKNPSFRPHIFSRGPDGHDETFIVDLEHAAARRVEIADPLDVRLTVRDREGVPLLDVHNEAGRRVTLFIPPDWTKDATVDERHPGDDATRTVALPDAALATEPVGAAPAPVVGATAERGTRDLFAALFRQPFGRRAFASFEETPHDAPVVYGVSRDDAERMALLIDELGDAERRNRQLTATGALITSAIFGVHAAVAFTSNAEPSDPTRTRRALDASGGAYAALSALAGGFATYTLVRPWAGEQLRREYHADLKSSSGDDALAFARAEARIRELAEGERRSRRTLATVGVVFAGMSAAFLVGGELADKTPEQHNRDRAIWGTSLLLDGLMVANNLILRSPVEKLANVWSREPTFRNLPQLSISSIKSGAMIGVQGRF
jgi:hypothetical protein